MKKLGMALGGFLSIFIFYGLSNVALAKADSFWDENVSVAEKGEISSTKVRERFDCDYKNAKVVNLKKPFTYILPGLPNLSSIEKNDIGEQCIVRNASGVFLSEYSLATGGEHKASYAYGPQASHMFSLRPKLPINVWLDPAPQSQHVFVFSKQSYSSSSYRVTQHSNFESSKPVVDGSTLTWDIGATDFERWKDSTGAFFYINNHSFSPNGKFMIVRYGSNGIVAKVDLQTLEMTPVHKNTAGNYDIAISNDGKFVSVLSGKDLRVINTSGCETSYIKGEWAKFYGFSVFPGCTNSINLIDTAASSGFSNENKRYERPYFDINSRELYISEGTFIDGKSYDGSAIGHYDWREIKFTAGDIEPNVKGYLALGDSFSSGEGDMGGDVWYEPGTDEQGNPETFEGRNLCHLSRRSYPYLMALELGLLASNLETPPADGDFHSVACSGAVMRNIIGGADGVSDGSPDKDGFLYDNQYRNDYFDLLDRWQPGRIKQLDHLETSVFGGGYIQSENSPEAITIGIGGNDAGFGDIISSCIKPSTCKYAVEGSFAASELAQTIASLKDKLSETYSSVKNSSPNSRIYVHGYPVFVQGYDGNCGLNTPLDSSETVFVEKGIRYMNSVVRAAAREAGVYYVDVSNILEGRNLCSGVEDDLSAFNGATAGNDKLSLIEDKILELVSRYYTLGNNCLFSSGCLGNESFHPNQMGHELYAQEILKQTNDLKAQMPDASVAPYPVPDSFFGNLAIEHINRVNESNGFITDYDVVIKQPKSFLNYKDQNTVEILQNGFYPGSTVVVSHQSEPTVISEFTVDENGLLQTDIDLPESLTGDPGEHEVHLEGLDSFGNPVQLYQPISIAFSSEDFDGDGELNREDSCSTLFNSFIDIDQDGVDDVCDGEVVVQTTQEEQDEGFVGLEKGQPNPETVAGNEQTVSQGVLGASVSTEAGQVLADTEELSNTGKSAIMGLVVSTVFVSLALLLTFRKANQD